MKISAIVVSVNYGDLLAKSIELWKRGLDELLVVTNPYDAQTRRLCYVWDVPSHESHAFNRGGAEFNKSGAMDEALAILKPSDWVLFFDADIVPGPDWRAAVEAANPRPGNLYGAMRRTECHELIRDKQIAGWFQLWHVSDPVAQARPLLGDWHNASGYDTQFQNRWHPGNRIILPIPMTHLGDTRRNWCGRGRDEAMAAMLRERRVRRGYSHERIT